MCSNSSARYSPSDRFSETADSMHRHRALSAALSSGLGLLLGTSALTAPGLARAQPTPAAPPAQAQPAAPPQAQPPAAAPEAAPPASQGVVRRIEVRGNERIEQST